MPHRRRLTRFWAAEPYEADFSHASGQQSDDPVEISGMRVGSVDEVRINGTHVTVTFHADDVRLGAQTRAAIKTSSAVGERYLALYPAGSGQLTRVPMSRTTVPYDLTAALADVTKDIFSGIAFKHGLLGSHHFVHAADVREITKASVHLSLSAVDAKKLEPYEA